MHAERETRLAGQQREAATIRLWLSHKSLSAPAKLAFQPRALGGNLDRKHGTVEARNTTNSSRSSSNNNNNNNNNNRTKLSLGA
jgi:hypothetical protein